MLATWSGYKELPVPTVDGYSADSEHPFTISMCTWEYYRYWGDWLASAGSLIWDELSSMKAGLPVVMVLVRELKKHTAADPTRMKLMDLITSLPSGDWRMIETQVIEGESSSKIHEDMLVRNVRALLRKRSHQYLAYKVQLITLSAIQLTALMTA